MKIKRGGYNRGTKFCLISHPLSYIIKESKTMNQQQFIAALKDKGIQLNEQQINQFDLYFKTLVEWNKKINLTTLTAVEDVYLKHFYDSITPAFYVDFNKHIHICDVGAGAGFPSLPLKICFPQLKVTIVDSLKKRITFLNHLASELELTDVAFHHDRAESFAQNKKHRQQYDLVTARAVAKMSVLSELCLPLVRQNGKFVALKGPNGQAELNEATQALKILGGEMESIFKVELPDDQGERNIIVINKLKNTPKKYPRKPGTPNKSPL